MENTKWIEVPVFIHGITPEAAPGSHTAQYASLNELIQQAFTKWNTDQKLGPLEIKKFDTDPIGVEWGWLTPTNGNISADEWLAQAEHKLLETVSKSETGWANFDFTVNPMRALRGITRSVIFQGIADLFYYVSRDGEIVIRDHVFSQIANGITKFGEEARISLTLITHSAGTLIAHDLLYQLFRSEEVMQAKIVTGEVPHRAVQELREKIAQDRLRVRRFYTLGSPIAPLIMRSTGLIRKSLKNEQLRACDIGLSPLPDLQKTRWVNFWDQDDFAAYPLSYLYEAGVVQDQYVDIGDSILLNAAHNLYWQSRSLATYIAENW